MTTVTATMTAFTSIQFAIVLHATLLVGSSSQDVLVLSLHAKKKFHCITTDNTYSYTWKVNETVVTSNSTFPDVVYTTSQTLSNGSIQGSLTFTAYANNTNIECFVTNGDNIITPVDYIVLIQGYLPPPDVTYVMEPHSVRFSWSAPFSLNITDYEPDIQYYAISIFTLDDKTTMNTTDTVYVLQPDLCLLSDYRVEIAAVNIVGMGEKYKSPPLSMEATTLNVSGVNVIFNKKFPVINIQISTTCQEDIHYNVELIPTFSTKRIVISNSSSVGQTSLTLSSSDIQLNEHYKAIVKVEGSNILHHLDLNTFDVQNVSMTHLGSVIDITCHFALGSLINGCIIIISNELNLEQCEYTATREEGSTEGTISVMLPRGEYTVVVYDDEDAEAKNPAYNSTITSSSSSVMLNTACKITMKINVSTKNETSLSSDTVLVLIAVVIPFAVITMVILLLISVMIYKCLNGTRNCCGKTSNSVAQHKNVNSTDATQDVVYASIPDLTQSSTSSFNPSGCSSLLSRKVCEGEQASRQSGYVYNPAPSMCLFETKLSAKDSSASNEQYFMANNPLYMMRSQSFMKPHGTITSSVHGTNISPVHHYECVTVRKM